MQHLTIEQFKSQLRSSKPANVELRKGYADSIEEVGEERSLTFTISTSDVDQMGDTIDQTGWDLSKFLQHPRVLWNHDTEKVIGKCVWIGVVGGKLKATVEFIPASNPFMGAMAEGVYQMCKGGFLNSTSVGFTPLDWDEATDDARRTQHNYPGVDFHRARLNEFSIVPFPCNLNATIEEPAFTPLPAEPKAAPEPECTKAGVSTEAARKRSLSKLALLRLQ